MKEDKIFFFKSLLFPLLILFSMWMVKFLEFIFNLNFVEFGVYPLKITGLLGIITAPFILFCATHDPLFIFLILGVEFAFVLD